MNNPQREGSYVYYVDENNLFHRYDGPAVIYDNGSVHYYKHGDLHREDGPAVILDSGRQEWYRDGKLHREDGPAIVTKELQKWYRNGMLHNVNGPAVVFDYGRQEYWKNNVMHRDYDDGPAVIDPLGNEYWVEGRKVG